VAATASNQPSAASGQFEGLAERLRFTKDRAIMTSREVAYEAVKQAILHGGLEPRERLIEERLADALGISRTPVREALAILEHEGLIEAIPAKGLMVKRITVDEFLAMYEALAMIEPALARAAIDQVSAGDLRAMTASLDEAERAIPDDVPGHLAACRAFLRRLGDCGGNPYLTNIIIGIEERSDMYLVHTQNRLPPERMLAAVADRRAILDAIRDGDAEAAVRAARIHTEAIHQRWRDLYVGEQSDHRR
jgi:DNA-binding GntR family transcriptional regulator